MKKFEAMDKDYATISFVPTTPVAAGDLVVLSDVAGFPLVDITQEDVDAEKLFTLIVTNSNTKVAKNVGEAWTPGLSLYYDDVGGVVTSTAGSNRLIGPCREAASATNDIGYVDFDGYAAFLKV